MRLVTVAVAMTAVVSSPVLGLSGTQPTLGISSHRLQQVALREVAGSIRFEATRLTPPKDLTRLVVYIGNAADEHIRTRISVGLEPENPSLPPIVPVKPDGTFVLVGLQPGVYDVIRIGRLPQGWWLRSALVNGRNILDAPLSIGAEPGELPPIALSVSDVRTSLSGTLAVPPGETYSSYTVVVFPEEAALRRPYSWRVKALRTPGTGRFIATDLPPGRYLVNVAKGFGPKDLFDPVFYQRLAEGAKLVVMNEGDNRTQDLIAVR